MYAKLSSCFFFSENQVFGVIRDYNIYDSVLTLMVLSVRGKCTRMLQTVKRHFFYLYGAVQC